MMPQDSKVMYSYVMYSSVSCSEHIKIKQIYGGHHKKSEGKELAWLECHSNIFLKVKKISIASRSIEFLAPD